MSGLMLFYDIILMWFLLCLVIWWCLIMSFLLCFMMPCLMMSFLLFCDVMFYDVILIMFCDAMMSCDVHVLWCYPNDGIFHSIIQFDVLSCHSIWWYCNVEMSCDHMPYNGILSDNVILIMWFLWCHILWCHTVLQIKMFAVGGCLHDQTLKSAKKADLL